MNRLSKLILFAALLAPVGCMKTVTATPPPPVPGAINTFDGETYKALAAAHAFVVSLSTNSAKLNNQQIHALNQMIDDLNAADTIYKAYHLGAATQAAMQKALDTVNFDQSAITTPITQGLK